METKMCDEFGRIHSRWRLLNCDVIWLGMSLIFQKGAVATLDEFNFIAKPSINQCARENRQDNINYPKHYHKHD